MAIHSSPGNILLDDALVIYNRPTQPSIPPGSVNEYQLRLGRQRQVWFISLADVRGVCTWNCEIPWERMPYLSALEVCSRQGAIQIHVTFTFTLYVLLVTFNDHQLGNMTSSQAEDWVQVVNKRAPVYLRNLHLCLVGPKPLGQQQRPCQAVNQTQTWWTRLLPCLSARLESAAHWSQNHHGHSCFRRKLKSSF